MRRFAKKAAAAALSASLAFAALTMNYSVFELYKPALLYASAAKTGEIITELKAGTMTENILLYPSSDDVGWGNYFGRNGVINSDYDYIFSPTLKYNDADDFYYWDCGQGLNFYIPEGKTKSDVPVGLIITNKTREYGVLYTEINYAELYYENDKYIVFDSWYGQMEMEKIDVKANDCNYKLPYCEFVSPEKEIFSGWNINDTIYQPRDIIPITSDVTVAVAQWIPDDEPFDPGEGVWGDASGDGEVKMNDVVLIMQSLSNADKYGLNGSDDTHITRKGQYWADVESNGNGVTPKDALQIQKYLVQLVDSLEPKK